MSFDLEEEVDETWRLQAACKNMNTDNFFVEYEWSVVEEMRKVCAGCPVRERCLEYSFTQNVPHGMWGGFTGPERALLKRGLPLRPLMICIGCGVRFRPRSAKHRFHDYKCFNKNYFVMDRGLND